MRGRYEGNGHRRGRLGSPRELCSAGAATLFVNKQNTACSDSGSGSATQPFCSIQTAVNKANPGDTVLVVAGTYGPAMLSISRSGVSGAPIVVKSWTIHGATIVGPLGAGESYGPGVKILGNYIDFDGFEVRDSAGSGIRNDASYVTIENNYVHDNATRCGPTTKCGQGIASDTSTNVGVVIERNLAAKNGSSTLDHNYYLSTNGMVIENNVALEAAGHGFQIYPNCNHCRVVNNVAFGNLNRSGFIIGGSSTTSSANVQIYNNISMNNGEYGFEINANRGQPVTLSNNIAFGNSRAALYNGLGAALVNRNLYSVDPQFVNAAGMDFHILSTSPARNHGSNDLFAPDDIDFEMRPLESVVDIGVDEYNPN